MVQAGRAQAAGVARDQVEQSAPGHRAVAVLGRMPESASSASRNAMIRIVGLGSLRLAWQTHFVGHLRAVNNNFPDTYRLKSQNALPDGRIPSIPRAVRVSFQRVNEVVKDDPVRLGHPRDRIPVAPSP